MFIVNFIIIITNSKLQITNYNKPASRLQRAENQG